MVELDIKEIINKISYQKLEDKVCLITGANGFLASSIIDVLMYLNEYYLDKKCTVIALCRDKEKAKLKLEKYLSKSYFKLFIQSVEEKINFYGKLHYIIHAASSAVTSDFDIIPADVLNANVIGTYNLLELGREKGIESFLFFSSGAVYGEIPKETEEINEESVFALDFKTTKNCYAEGKRAGEALCRAYWEQYEIPAKAVRISHTYGPGINLNDGRVFSDFVSKICNRKNLVIKGEGNDVRPFCYITDAIVAFFLILFNGENGGVYNMANNKETVTIRELAEKLVYEAFPERGLGIECKNLAQNVCNKKVKVNTDKLIELGWSPQIDIIEGFRRTVKNYEEDTK